MGVILRFFVIAAGITMIVFTAAAAWRSGRKLNRRIEVFKEELETQQNTPGPINPYAAMAEMYEQAEPGPALPLPPRRSKLNDLPDDRPGNKR